MLIIRLLELYLTRTERTGEYYPDCRCVDIGEPYDTSHIYTKPWSLVKYTVGKFLPAHFSGLPEPFWRTVLTHRIGLTYKFQCASNSWTLYKPCGTWIKAIEITDGANRERLIHESSRCTTVLSRKGWQNSGHCMCTLRLIEAELAGNTERGVALVEGRIFFLS